MPEEGSKYTKAYYLSNIEADPTGIDLATANVDLKQHSPRNEFERLLEMAIQGTTVVITKDDSPRAVLISIDHFQTLQEAPQMKLNTLTEQIDTFLERMQSTKARHGMAAGFRANNKQLGKAAVAAARKRVTPSNAADKKSGSGLSKKSAKAKIRVL